MFFKILSHNCSLFLSRLYFKTIGIPIEESKFLWLTKVKKKTAIEARVLLSMAGNHSGAANRFKLSKGLIALFYLSERNKYRPENNLDLVVASELNLFLWLSQSNNYLPLPWPSKNKDIAELSLMTYNMIYAEKITDVIDGFAVSSEVKRAIATSYFPFCNVKNVAAMPDFTNLFIEYGPLIQQNRFTKIGDFTDIALSQNLISKDDIDRIGFIACNN